MAEDDQEAPRLSELIPHTQDGVEAAASKEQKKRIAVVGQETLVDAAKRCQELEKELEVERERRRAAEKAVADLEQQVLATKAIISSFTERLEKQETSYSARFELLEARMSAVGTMPVVPRGTTEKGGRADVLGGRNFPPLSRATAQQNPSTEPTGDAPAALTPTFSQIVRKTGRLTPLEASLFHRPPPVKSARHSLVNDGSDLLPLIVRRHFGPVALMPISHLKEILAGRGVPVHAIASLDFFRTRQTSVTGYGTLEVIVSAPAANALVNTMKRFGAKELVNFSPSDAADPRASPEVKQLIKQKYLGRMKAHANRQGSPVHIRRLFRQLFVRDGGDEDSLEALETDAS